MDCAWQPTVFNLKKKKRVFFFLISEQDKKAFHTAEKNIEYKIYGELRSSKLSQSSHVEIYVGMVG